MKRAADPTMLLLSVLCCLCVSSMSDSAVNQKMDPRQCLAQNGTQSDKPQIRFEVLPGVGFDNLRNLDAGQVIMYTYSDCKSTDDGKYLIPDSAFILPIKQSTLEIFAEVFQHWSSYTSATSSSINVEAGGSYGGFEISGKFSDEFQSMKTHQVQDKSVTTRVQVRHTFYTAKLQPDAPLHPTFKSRLLNIAAHLQNNNTAVARYLSQLLVRDYGTHVVTSVDAGAALVKEDHVKNTFMSDTENSKSKISASASASFLSLVHFNAGFSTQDSESSQQQYMGNRTSSAVRTHGGPAFRTNFTVRYWEEGLDNELVAIDRAGDPLHYFVTTATLPELPDPTISDLGDLVKDAIGLYYKFNTHKGCTKQGAPNFSFQANVDDGSCKPQQTNFTFGGVYQTCSSSASAAGDLCASLAQKNPLSGDFKCPKNYRSVFLHEGVSRRSEKRRVCERKCHHCGWWSRCCGTECGNRQYSSVAHYQAFWCVALAAPPGHSGYLFGGLYSSTIANPITSACSCPLHFYQLRIVADLHVCVSDDYELGSKYALPFAGFFSCITGNPLSTGPEALTDSSAVHSQEMPSLQQFMMTSGPQKWPKSCPDGFSQHLAAIDDSCEINYCVRMGSLGDLSLPKIRRPPFSPQPGDNPNSTNTLFIVGVAGKVWAKNDSTNSWVRTDRPDKGTLLTWAKEFLDRGSENPTNSPQSDEGAEEVRLSAGAAAGIAVAATVICGLLLIALVSRVRKRRERSNLLPTVSRTALDPEHVTVNGDW